MKRLIVRLLEGLSIIIAGILLLVGFLVGREMGQNVGAPIEGAIVGLIVALVVDVLIFGALFIFLEMNESLREIVKILKSQSRGIPRPTISASPSRVSDVTSDERPPADSDTTPRGATMSTASYPFSFVHKGKTVHHNNKIFVVDEKEFQNAAEAKQYIDDQM